MVDASYDPERIAEQHEFGGCAEKIANLTSEIARMKPVVEAAQKWRDCLRLESWMRDVESPLVEAVDEYEKSLK